MEQDHEKCIEALNSGLRGGSEARIHVWSRLLRRHGGRRFDGQNNTDVGREKPTLAILTLKFHSIG